jgi:hypothetical protein
MRNWISDSDMIKYQDSVTLACATYQIQEGINLDSMSNEEYKKAVLECYRKALDEVPMPAETP